MFGFVSGFKAAVWQGLAIVVGVGLVIGAFTWAFNNKQTFTAVAGSVGNAAASVVIASADWVAQQAGGSASSAAAANAARVGPEVIWVDNKAPRGWQVGPAIRLWNKGLTDVQLKAGKCHPGSPCIKISQGHVYTPDGQPLRLGNWSRLFHKITLNGDAVGQVPAQYFAWSTRHELGHALGLDHSTSRASVMYPYAKGAAAVPSKADYAAVNAKHGG